MSTTESSDNAATSVDVPALLTSDNGTLLSAVAMASQYSNSRILTTKKQAEAFRKSFGRKKGCTSTIIICNKTAALLKFDKASNRRGTAYGPETKNRHVKNYPVQIQPGENVLFLHVNPTKSLLGQPTFEGTAGVLAFSIVVYDVEKGSWVDSSQAVAFSWKTASGSVNRAPNKAQFENVTGDTERYIRRSGSAYDGTKICCELQVEGVDSTNPVYVYTFSQEERRRKIDYPRAQDAVPFGARAKQWLGGQRAEEERSAKDKAPEEKKFDGMEGYSRE